MPFNIAEFKSIVEESGILQDNKYDVLFNAPPGLIGSNLNADNLTSLSTLNQDLYYRCVNATLPGLILRTADVNRFGSGVLEKMPFSGSYTDVDLQFIVDKRGNAYKFWYAWLNYIFAMNGEESNQIIIQNSSRKFYTTQYKDNYSTDFFITIYDNEGRAAFQYKLYKAFPIFLSDTALSWNNKNQYLVMSTRITFREWSIMQQNNFGDTPITLTSTTNQTTPPT